VYHNVDPSRYTLEHIEKTVIAGIMTQYRLRRDLYAPLDWSEGYVEERIRQAERDHPGTACHPSKEGNEAERVYKVAEGKGFEMVLGEMERDYERRRV